jgi:hypothetical protein
MTTIREATTIAGTPPGARRKANRLFMATFYPFAPCEMISPDKR